MFIEDYYVTESYGMKDTWRSWGLHIVREDKTINKKRKEGERSRLHLLSKIKRWDPM